MSSAEKKVKKQILAIEDDEAMRQLLEHILSKDYEVTAIGNGLKAMQWMTAGNVPDLILTDIDVPGLSGEEFLVNIRKSGFFREVPVVILSGRAAEAYAQGLIEKGATATLVKPFARDELTDLVSKVLGA